MMQTQRTTCITYALLMMAVMSWTGVVFARRGPEPPLNPKTYKSRSGEYTLEIDPTHRNGHGKGNYVFSKNGKRLWAKEFPFTLQEAKVTNEGRIAGYSYSLGPRGKPFVEAGTFHVVLLSKEDMGSGDLPSAS